MVHMQFCCAHDPTRAHMMSQTSVCSDAVGDADAKRPDAAGLVTAPSEYFRGAAQHVVQVGIGL